MAWVRMTAHNASFRQIIRKSNGSYGWYFCINSENELNFTPSNAEFLDGFAFPADSEWHHAAATFNGATVRIYLDGEEVASYSGIAMQSDSDVDALWIASSNNGTQRFPGKLDDIRLYSRVLAGSEVRDYSNLSLSGYPGLLNRVSVPMNSSRFGSGDAAVRSTCVLGGSTINGRKICS